MTSYLEMCKSEVNTFLAALYPAQGPTKVLYDAMNYSLLTDGKRLRPTLCLATAETFGIARNQVLPVAVALELIHCYSLIHDDLPCMDDDDLRRGKPTNHRVFGEAVALLAGDALLTEAFFQLAKRTPGIPPDRQLKMVQIVAERAGAAGMVGGQTVDIEKTGQGGTLDDVAFIHLHKTARLIQASIELGALFPDISEAKRNALSVYGEALGLAFQMVDDVLDVVGSAEELGKTPGKDALVDKLTFPKFIGVEETLRRAQEIISNGQKALQSEGITSPYLFELQTTILERSR
ncbi:polyprenyl synthetase family protein [Alicyclobacillus fodiniaquatilis]|uniref:Polyprenyl synthetase family protein n=1 Tax=Alicyclobacillus fodiniaquatilis TaxID=1661150 RepID=A0ABW4JIM8_9BACL